MILRTYIVNDMQEGMEQIKRELGLDAVILSTKEYKKKGIKGWFSKPKLEIVAAYDPDDRISVKSRERRSAQPVQRKTASQRNTNGSGISSELEISAIENRLSKLDNTLSSFMQRIENNYSDKFTAYPKEIRSFAGKLLDSDVREEIVYELADRIQEKVRKNNTDVNEAVEEVVKDYLGEPKPIDPDKKNQVILFLGTTGVGKTTTLSKYFPFRS
ncbi:MAG: hypothetical protein J1F64_09745 [Oscillospiraceae bacterium]|nr:hypothetical protein [Oscillospiraceae bacterium]